jgi:hypothetical protein
MAAIFAKERAVLTTTSAQLALANLTAAATLGANLDVRALGNTAEDFEALFELTVQWVTPTAIVLNTKVADLYLLPSLDGTVFPDVDLTAGSSALPLPSYIGSFVAVKAPAANTNMVFTINLAILHPVVYKPYLLNTSGQTISAGWTLRDVSAQAQYS